MRSLVIALMLTASLVADRAGAQGLTAARGPSPSPAPKAPAGVAPKAPVLPPKEKKIDPVVFAQLAKLLEPPTMKEVEELLKRADATLGEHWTKVHMPCQFVEGDIKYFAEKAFSPQDQKAAGCLPTDTVQACSKKLLEWALHGSNNWKLCRAQREPYAKELEGLEQEIRLFRLKVAAFGNF